jgi:hypothetical protein
MQDQKKQNMLITGLTSVALVALIVAYFAPIWWVSLTAPNYPKDAFPDGIRIHFHFNGVFNGCSAVGKGTRMGSETLQADVGEDTPRYNPILDKDKDVNKVAKSLDCVHEMNTINHYVGMYPIDTGSPVELRLSKFIFGWFAVMLLGFMATQRKTQLKILSAGFAAVVVWMVVDQIAMGQLDAFATHYYNEAKTFFNQPDVLANWKANLILATKVAMAGIAVAMAIILLGVWKIPGFSLLLPLVPALMPVFFVIDYAGWLWFFGHNMHPWGAFTVKPFMPTVFGEGKVAQFSTFSYPYWGYAVLLLASGCLMMALLLRRRQMRNRSAS